jgi:molybdate transport system substrate-binding protein
MLTGGRRRVRCRWMSLLTAWLCCATAAAAQDLTVAAAADLQPVLPALATTFLNETGHAVALTFGSSGNFFSQIQNGAPFDVFLSADIKYPKRLEAGGLTEPGSLSAYATGTIRRGLQILLDPAVRKIAIANPEHAPYGRAAVAALQHEGIYDSVRSRLVLGENVSQSAQFVQSGNADIGIVALSLALGAAFRDAGTYYEIPAPLYPPIEQAAVVLKSSHSKDLARQFVAFLKRPDVARRLQTFGFGPPQA